MNKFKITNLIALTAALILEILPYGGRLNWESFFFESVSYHSYFDLTLWKYENTSPLFCGILTCILLLLSVTAMFTKPRKFYFFSASAIALVTTMISVVPTFQNAYTLVGLIITILLGVATEMSIVCYTKTKK